MTALFWRPESWSEVRENTDKHPRQQSLRSHLDERRPALGVAFLAGYLWHTFAPGSFGTAIFLVTGAVLFAISVPWASAFHRAFALVAFAALGAAILTGRFGFANLLAGMPDYFGIVAVLLVLSIAGYPIRAARYEAQIRALVAALTRRGVGFKATAGALGHVLGAVLDVGAFVLIDVISARAAPKERLEALKWAGRTFSFAPLWTNLNVLTATTIVLTGVSYPSLLAATLPFVLLGLAATLLAAQREKGEVEDLPETRLDRGAAAVLLYPVLLVAAVALANLLFPGLALTATIAVTVALVVLLIALFATGGDAPYLSSAPAWGGDARVSSDLARRVCPLRLGRATRALPRSPGGSGSAGEPPLRAARLAGRPGARRDNGGGLRRGRSRSPDGLAP
jgi:hypothetical protein